MEIGYVITRAIVTESGDMTASSKVYSHKNGGLKAAQAEYHHELEAAYKQGRVCDSVVMTTTLGEFIKGEPTQNEPTKAEG
jgi:major membrane immunogen (membrane-anchored lipoprotein)